MSAPTRLDQLRDFFGALAASEASYEDPAGWEALCAFFEDWPEAEDLEVAADYAAEHAAGWAPWVRLAPDAWAARLLATGAEPRLRIAADLEIYEGDRAALAIAGCPDARNLHRLALRDAEVGDEGLIALANSPHLPRLSSLTLELAECHDAALAALGHAAFRLEVLELHNAYGVTDKGLRHIRTAPAFEPLRELVLEYASVTPARVVNLLQSPRGRRLTRLVLGDIDDGEIARFIHDNADTLALTELDLGEMWDAPADVREALAERYEMTLE